MKRSPLFRWMTTLAAVAVLAVPAARAQSYPDKPITLVVPYPAGTLADLFARAAADEMQGTLKQTVIVDNKAGANQIVGAAYTARAPADGYTLMVTAEPSVIPASMLKSLPFTGMTDFEPVGNLVAVPLVLAVSSNTPASNLKEFVALLKDNPGKYSYASSGIGSPIHLFAEMFNKEVGVKAVHVPYKSYQPAMTDMMSGLINYCFLPLSAMEYVKQGKLKAIAISSATRDPDHPDLVTLAEGAGMKGFEMTMKYLVIAPKGTPAPVVSKLNAAINSAVTGKALAAKVKPVGGVIVAAPGTPAQAGALIAREESRWNQLVKTQGIDLTAQ